MSTKAQREIVHKLKVFAHAEQNGNVALTCRYFGISQDTFYRWKKNYKSKGEIGLINSKRHAHRTLNYARLLRLKIRLFIYVNTIILDSYGSVSIYGVITKLRFQQLGYTMF